MVDTRKHLVFFYEAPNCRYDYHRTMCKKMSLENGVDAHNCFHHFWGTYMIETDVRFVPQGMGLVHDQIYRFYNRCKIKPPMYIHIT